MADADELREADKSLTDEEKLENVIRLAFNGDRERFDEFCRILEQHTPATTIAVLGGSSVTGHSYKDGRPFDGGVWRQDTRGAAERAVPRACGPFGLGGVTVNPPAQEPAEQRPSPGTRLGTISPL